MVGLLAFQTSVSDIDSLGRFLPSLVDWPGETSITRGNPSEAPLSLSQLTSFLFLYSLDFLLSMFLTMRAISHNLSR